MLALDLNAQHLRNVPGRKTGVKDSEWICQLVAHGLVWPSFMPPPEIRRLRDLTRFLKAQINERIRAIQRIEKVLQDAGIKLTSVASQASSKSARAMLEALLSGVHEPEHLAGLARGRLRSKIPQLRDALESRFKVDHHGIIVAQWIAHIDALDHAIAALDEKIDQVLTPHRRIVKLLCTIPGVAVRTAQVLKAAARAKGTYLAAHHMRSCAVARSARRAEGDRRHPPRHPRRLLLHRSRRGPIPRARPRLAASALLARASRSPPGATARSARLQGHDRSQPGGSSRRAGGHGDGLKRTTTAAGLPTPAPAVPTPATQRPADPRESQIRSASSDLFSRLSAAGPVNAARG